jgi:hypothetical protein
MIHRFSMFKKVLTISCHDESEFTATTVTISLGINISNSACVFLNEKNNLMLGPF